MKIKRVLNQYINFLCVFELIIVTIFDIHR